MDLLKILGLSILIGFLALAVIGFVFLFYSAILSPFVLAVAGLVYLVHHLFF